MRSWFKSLNVLQVLWGVLLIISLVFAFLSIKQQNSDTACYEGEIGAVAQLSSGQYKMGSTQYYRDEGPITPVSVDSFNIDTHEVTNAQFQQFIEATGYITSAERATELGFDANGSAVFSAGFWSFVEGANWRNPEGPDSTISGREYYPVVQVSYEDALAYASWAGRALPTEKQWEYAARNSLTESEYERGNSLTSNDQHTSNTWQGAFPIVDTADDGFSSRAPIGCYEANTYGIFDLIGNVWEWTADSYYPQHQFQGERILSANGNDVGLDPNQKGIPVGVIKGGSFLCSKNYCQRYRPAARHAQDMQLGTNHIGFRTVSSDRDFKQG